MADFRKNNKDDDDGFIEKLVNIRRVVKVVKGSKPPSRAASANAFTRPWYLKPERSKAIFVTFAFFAALAISAPILVAAATLPPFFSFKLDALTKVLVPQALMICA
jgi:hypothetical protein